MKRRDYETLKQHLATNLRTFRRDMRLSQEALSLNADVDRTYVSQIERGIKNPSLLVLSSLADALEKDVSELLLPPSIPEGRSKQR